MNYIIHNERCIRSESQRQQFREVVRRQVGRLNAIYPHYPNSIVIDLYLNKIGRDLLQISAIVNLRGEIIYIKEEGKNPEAILRNLFDGIMLKMTRTINREKRGYLSDRKDKQYKAFIDNLSELRNLRKEKAGEMFQWLIRLISGDVATYIRRRLKSAEMTTAVNRGMFKVQELLDEQFLMAYERFEDVPEDGQDIRSWLYRMADDLLRQKFMELEFEKNNFEKLDALVEAEYKSLEDFSIHSEGEILPAEEVFESGGMTDWYQADILVYGEDEDSLLDEITLNLNQQEIHRLIEKELAKLPVLKRTIMDLYLISQMNPEEIAAVKGLPIVEVEETIRELSRDLSNKLSLNIS